MQDVRNVRRAEMQWRKDTKYSMVSVGLENNYTIAAFKCDERWLFRASKAGRFFGSVVSTLDEAKMLCVDDMCQPDKLPIPEG